jgi:protein transport protein SEC61 subunit gamma and related proteins
MVLGIAKEKINSFYLQCLRVWHLLRKPTNDEFKSVAKISALGILAMGAVGFIIADIIKIFFK